jgi:hypothetical protein
MKNAHLPFDRLMALSKVEGQCYPHSSSLRRTDLYASLLGISGALHLDVFDQPAKYSYHLPHELTTMRQGGTA